MPPADPILPPPSPEAAVHSHQLAEHIANAILCEGDWIPFSRFMELVLYAPGLGYYAAGARKFGVEGDFVTAPEISPVFAKCLAMQADQVLKAVGGEVLELGPGSGALAADLFGELKAAGAAPERYLLLEVSAELRERQRAKLAERFPEDFGAIRVARPAPGADPRLRGRQRGPRRGPLRAGAAHGRGAARARRDPLRGRLRLDDDQPMPDGELKRRALAVFPPGGYEYLSEIGLAAEALVRTVAHALEAGVALFIDYGFPEREYYHPQRSMGTLRCHYRHRYHGDPFFLPGLQDITAHVDFTAMARAGEQGGAEVFGFTTQAYFLISCGLAVLVSEGDPNMTLSRLKATSAVHRLINPSEMGELFKVLGLGRGIDGPLLGFQSARHIAL